MNGRRQVVITEVMGKKLLFYMEQDRLYDVLAEPQENGAPAVGNIYLGKVQNVVKNINAAFVEVQKDVLCYLPLSECGDNVKCGDELVVQVKKAAVRSKQAVATRFPEMTGRYCVIRTAGSDRGISKKITDSGVRERLGRILQQFEGEPYSLVLRTAAQDAPEEAVEEECRRLFAALHEKLEYSRYKTCFSLLWGEVPFYIRYLYSCQPGELDRIVTDDREVYERLQPEYGEMTEFYGDGDYPLDKLFGLSSKLGKALEKRVWLKSGGNLVIEPTEALTVMDVNTGKAVEGKRNKETTFFRINCEAALEAARQMRLRSISGIILIDFIDMKKQEHRQELMELLRRELQKDKTRTSLVDITKLGLVEITRMKQHPPLWEIFQTKG